MTSQVLHSSYLSRRNLLHFKHTSNSLLSSILSNYSFFSYLTKAIFTQFFILILRYNVQIWTFLTRTLLTMSSRSPSLSSRPRILHFKEAIWLGSTDWHPYTHCMHQAEVFVLISEGGMPSVFLMKRDKSCWQLDIRQSF